MVFQRARGGEGRSVKTGERRYVPIHPALISEDFLDYVQTVCLGRPLFPDKTPDRHGNRGGRSWNLLGTWARKTVGIQDINLAPSHSWRHRVEDELWAAGVKEYFRDALLGHARKTTGGSMACVAKPLPLWRSGLLNETKTTSSGPVVAVLHGVRDVRHADEGEARAIGEHQSEIAA